MHHLPLPNSHSETEEVLQENMIMYMNSHSNNQNNNVVENLLLMGSGNVIQTGIPSQGLLSLSLGTHVPSVMQISRIGYHSDSPSYISAVLDGSGSGNGNALMNVPFDNEDGFRNNRPRGECDYVISSGPEGNSDDNVYTYGMASIGRGVSDSNYLRAAQQLLDEVVSVKKVVKERKVAINEAKMGEGDERNDPGTAVARNEHSVAEKQELQNKLSKLLSMLDEVRSDYQVDRRYRQYHDEMQIVASSFDVIAGAGAAKPYTALALQTISQHFRCLRDAVIGQIAAVRKSLGEENSCLNDNKRIGISRLHYVDQQLRQHRALQQLGMAQQQNVWRPQRGLPETSVSILRAWLFEHFLHPYPNDSEKLMLARNTGLTRSQVSNWFINARVRLWKPMIEVIYKEETGDADMNFNSSSETIPRPPITTEAKLSEEKADEDLQQSATSSNTMKPMESRFDRLLNEVETTMGTKEASSVLQNTMHCSTSDRFGNVSGLSLTLGLEQRGEGGRIGMTDNSMSRFVHLRNGEVYRSSPDMGTEMGEFECMGSSGNQAQQFVSSLLPSFT